MITATATTFPITETSGVSSTFYIQSKQNNAVKSVTSLHTVSNKDIIKYIQKMRNEFKQNTFNVILFKLPKGLSGNENRRMLKKKYHHCERFIKLVNDTNLRYSYITWSY